MYLGLAVALPAGCVNLLMARAESCHGQPRHCSQRGHCVGHMTDRELEASESQVICLGCPEWGLYHQSPSWKFLP